jgi:hypothetical protein
MIPYYAGFIDFSLQKENVHIIPNFVPFLIMNAGKDNFVNTGMDQSII